MGRTGRNSTAEEGTGMDSGAFSAAAGDGSPVDVSVLPPHAVEAVTALLAASAALAQLDPAELDGPQAAAVAAAATWVASQQTVAAARMLPVVEADGLWAVSGAKSFPQWVARTHRLGIRAARQRVALGRALRDHLP